MSTTARSTKTRFENGQRQTEKSQPDADSWLHLLTTCSRNVHPKSRTGEETIGKMLARQRVQPQHFQEKQRKLQELKRQLLATPEGTEEHNTIKRQYEALKKKVPG